MDSRIREIEQWIAEAKADLGECGQDAYIRKLYLLDAEIRAVIRENGILPGADSPRRQGKQVRRFATPALAFSGVLFVLILTATTVYLTGQQASGPDSRSGTVARLANSAGASVTTAVDDGYIPDGIPGEVIMPAGWVLPADTSLGGAVPAAVQPAAHGSTPTSAQEGVVLARALPADSPGVRTEPPAQAARSLMGNDATSVVLTSAMGPFSAPAATSDAPGGAASGSLGGREHVVGRLTMSPDGPYDDFPGEQDEAEKGFSLSRKASELGGLLPEEINVGESEDTAEPVDNPESTEEENVDNSDLPLDADALKEALEKPFSR